MKTFQVVPQDVYSFNVAYPPHMKQAFFLASGLGRLQMALPITFRDELTYSIPQHFGRLLEAIHPELVYAQEIPASPAEAREMLVLFCSAVAEVDGRLAAHAWSLAPTAPEACSRLQVALAQRAAARDDVLNLWDAFGPLAQTLHYTAAMWRRHLGVDEMQTGEHFAPLFHPLFLSVATFVREPSLATAEAFVEMGHAILAIPDFPRLTARTYLGAAGAEKRLRQLLASAEAAIFGEVASGELS